MARFQCKKCNHHFDVNKMVMSFKDGKTIYKYKNGKEIRCVKCKGEVIYVKLHSGFCTNFGKFNSMSDSQKKDMLRKRASEHTRKKEKDSIQHIKEKYGDK